MPYDDWLSADEYPDDDDIAAFGDDSPPDNDPLTIGFVGDKRGGFWSPRRIVLFIGAVALVLLLIWPLLRF